MTPKLAVTEILPSGSAMRHLLDGDAHALGMADGVDQVATGQGDDEFFAAETADKIVRTGTLEHRLCRFSEYLIAD